ncbi:MAG TPA: nuclear transport factor 2 family protein [Acidimicrobiales bacterium]|jgi:ketosteroid isomerase-like protein
MHDIVAEAYDRWAAEDHDGLLALFADDAVFVVPGSTAVSGTHDKAAFRQVLETVSAATEAGRHRQELVCSYDGEGGSACVFDNVVVVDAVETKYHSVHEWILRDGVPHVWMLYVHEYDLFQAVWA